MKINYIKTIGFRKFKKQFEADLFDITKITGKNRSGKTNILYAIINIMLGTNLSGDEKCCLINKNCDASYGELHFTDNNGIKHTLVRGKHRFDNNRNFISLDGKSITQKDLTSFYNDKRLFLSIINPLYFLNKKPAEQKEMVDKYLSEIKPKDIFNTLTEEQKNFLLRKYFYISIKEIYPRLSIEELEGIYNEHKLKEITGKDFAEIVDKEKWNVICKNIKNLTDVKYYDMLSEEEKEKFINQNMLNICFDIAYNNLAEEEKEILEGVPRDIPSYINEINGDIKTSQTTIASLDGKIEYAQKIANEELETRKKFEKDTELSLARQEFSFLSSNKDIINKEKQEETIEKLEKEILSKETESNELQKFMKDGKKKYLAIKNGESSICPTCEQHIQDENKNKTISNMRTELVSYYDRNNLLEAQIQQLKINLSVEKCKFHALDGNTTVKNTERLKIVEESIKQLEKEQLEIEKFNNEISIKENNINKAKLDIANFNKEKQARINFINNLNNAKKVAQKLYISYIGEKMKLAKKYLHDVDIKFYSVLKTTGEIKEDFVITYKNHCLSDLSKSETIATALELANMFNQITCANFPIFIDDYESCVDYDFISNYSKNTQIIVSQVKKGNALTIANHEDETEFTVIKKIIKGCKTITINKNRIADVKKAA